MGAASGSVSSHELYHFYLEGLVLPVSSIPSSSYTLSASEPQEEEFDGDILFKAEVFRSLSLSIMPACGSLYLFLSVGGGSFSYDG